MERLLHYVWKYRLYAETTLTTTEGFPVRVIDPGTPNSDAGPDFFNAKIKIEDTLWAGSIEVHDKASDWLLHRHDRDKAYDGVILHITACNDADIRRTNGEPVPQLVLSVPDSIRNNIDWLLHQDTPLACHERLHQIPPLHVSLWLDALLSERLERKTQSIYTLLDQYGQDWNEVFYITLTRAFGFGTNSDAFEWLARSLPLRCIQKQRGSQTQVEALLFGQAGMLEETHEDRYYRLLQREYRFLQHKFSLKPLDESLFKSLRMRPVSFPPLKLAQLAALWMQHDTLFSAVLDAPTPADIKAYFRVSPSTYWETHYHFRYSSPTKAKPIGEGALNILLINSVIPLYFAYGQRNRLPEYGERAIRLLESLPPEQNSIVTLFLRAGLTARNAGDTQALIQLKREYCEKKKCLYCRLGFQLLKRINNR